MFFDLVEEYRKREGGNESRDKKGRKRKPEKRKAQAKLFRNGCAPCNACVLQGARLFFVAGTVIVPASRRERRVACGR